MAVEDLGFDGVFLNVEQIWNGDEDFLALLRTVRAALDEETPIAVAIPPDWSPLEVDIPVPPNIVPGTVWDKEYKQRVALLTNQMAVMAYNSGLNSAEDFDRDDYIEWMAYQVEVFAEAVGELETETQLVIGIPSYGPELPAHDPLVENVASALEGVRLGISRIGERAQYVQGVAIYASWETDENEWAQFKSGWVDQ
jgi:hypothetical protein